ncbi:MAG: oxygenase MpaB family protein [Actinomycetota bacterium]
MGDVELPFQPGTVSQDVLRRPVFLLGGMNALLLQLAEPGVAAGVAEHSEFANRIFDRLRHTIDLMVEIGLGDPSDAERATYEMEEAHRGVAGSMPDGSTYDASDPELRLWVLATLIATVLEVEETYVGEFGEEERRRYIQESHAVARALGVDLPPDIGAFRRYLHQRLENLEVTPQARQVADHVLHARIGLIPPAALAPLRVVTADLLPPRLRAAYGLYLSPRQRRWLRRVQGLSRMIFPRLPHWIRTFPILRPTTGVRELLRER